MSKKIIVLIVLVVTLALTLFAGLVSASTRADVVIEIASFNPLAGEFPEGAAVDKKGNIYVGLGAPLGDFGEIRRIDPDGTQTTVLRLDGGPGPAGLAVDAQGNVYYALFTLDENTRGVYRLTGDGATERLPGTGGIMLANGLAFDKRGNLYVSDSIPGIIWRIPRDGSAEMWQWDESLLGCGFTPGFPPVGANGIAHRHNNLYVASTEQGLIVQIPILPDGTAGDPEIIAGDAECDAAMAGLDSVDGIALDVHGDIFALLVMQNKLVKVDTDTGAITELLNGDDGLHNPASIAFGTGRKMRQTVFFTNFALIPPGPPGTLGPAVLAYDVGVPGLPIP
jgi:sugar lactone lactonase YvrE